MEVNEQTILGPAIRDHRSQIRDQCWQGTLILMAAMKRKFSELCLEVHILKKKTKKKHLKNNHSI